MSTLIHHPKRLLPEELDHYLSMGWRPTGQSIYNSNFLRLENGEVVSVLPTRMELTNYTFTKSLRKLLRRNLARFRVAYGPATMPSPDFLAVNQRYMLYCPDKSLENLEYHVLGNKLRRVFNTWETRVYDGDRLVAFSYFDLGSDSAYSKAGIYDPIYSKHSLGLFTLLLEVELCLRMQKAFFYPGYVSDEDEMFNYKHRLGKLFFYDMFSRCWRAYGEYPVLQKPLKINQSKLLELKDLIKFGLIDSKLFIYPYLDLRYSVEGPSRYLDAPLLLHLKQSGNQRHLVVIYDNENGVFRVLDTKVVGFIMLRRVGMNQAGLPYFSDPLRTMEQLYVSASAKDVFDYLFPSSLNRVDREEQV